MKKLTSGRAVTAILATILMAFAAWIVASKMHYGRISSNQTAAVAALRTYLGAQNQYYRTEGRLASWAELVRFGLVHKAMAEATTPERARAGYYFVEIRTEGVDIPSLCAVPAKYRKTGRNTFVIDVTGVVHMKDTGGKPVRTWPDIADGWIPIGAE